ncbi:dipeptidase [Tundrisphaera lichenicola]|uniref:dipeptidase n=1 Tax=Tundrisphaera lichenicola TaxID=2029860 RepID=UPI003EB83B5F
MIFRWNRFACLLIVLAPTLTFADGPVPISERAKKIHESGMLFDGHNDLPWRLREVGDPGFESNDLKKRLASGQTDIPRLREGGVKAQFWSVYIPSDQPNPARTVVDQIDQVYRMVERYPDDFEMAYSAEDVERVVKSGKIASLIGIEGGVAIENDLAMLRMFARLGARYMTLTHNKNLDWADAANDEPEHDGLTPFGETVVKEMNRLGMLVDISHVSPATMSDVLRVTQAPVIASHSSARALADHPRNVPDDILKEISRNGGVIMVNFFPGFIMADEIKKINLGRDALKAAYPDPAEYEKALARYNQEHPYPRGTVKDVAHHIDHIAKVAGIDHVGIGSDFDGINSVPVGLEDVSTYPRLTEELLNRGYSESDIHKILGENALRALREAGKVGERLQRTTQPSIEVIRTKKE